MKRVALVALTLSAVATACALSDHGTPSGATTGSGGAKTSATNATTNASSSTGGSPTGAGGAHASVAASSSESATASSSMVGSSSAASSSGAPPCATRITYGDAWIHPANHPASFDDVTGPVTWDGTCTTDGSNSFALLSNGFKPYFSGASGCVLALDTTCASAPTCTTRVAYGAGWLPPANHPMDYDDVPGRVTWDRTCADSGKTSYATLSNGWAPHFTGSQACALSLLYTDCGGLYDNSVMPSGCADPGVTWDGTQYIVACTSGDAADAFPMSTSPNLVDWTPAGSIFPSASKPTWAASDFWAPEIHKVGTHYVAYFTARGQDGVLAIGAATAQTSLGPFTDIGQPIVHDASMGMIDATEFVDGSGAPYLAWKEDGNAVGMPTPIHAQALSPDGTALVGSSVVLITNDQTWEGPVVEAPWVVLRNGTFYLFYSGDSYANSTYSVGVARASNPLGPYTKAGGPILVTNGSWIGPGHCSVVDTPAGDTAMIYHAWIPGAVNGPGDVRVLMVDGVVWSGGWPSVPEAPSASSRPVP